MQAGIAHTPDTWGWVIGITFPWKNWHKPLYDGVLSGRWDVHVGQWWADGRTGRMHSNLVGAAPSLRWQPDHGESRWFIEGGVGLNYVHPRFITAQRTMSTRANFVPHVALGRLHGMRGQHEWQLRLEHNSNGGLKEPNSGQNFLQLRYARVL
jgi:hypothetical protein